MSYKKKDITHSLKVHYLRLLEYLQGHLGMNTNLLQIQSVLQVMSPETLHSSTAEKFLSLIPHIKDRNVEELKKVDPLLGALIEDVYKVARSEDNVLVISLWNKISDLAKYYLAYLKCVE